MKKALFVLLLLCLMLVPSVRAQFLTPTMAGVQGGVLVYFYDGAPPEIMDSTGTYYRNLQWSPNGEYLAYLRGDASFNWQLVVRDTTGTVENVVVPNYSFAVPTFSWTDNNILVYAEFDPTFQPTGPDTMINIYLNPLMPGTSPALYMAVPYGGGCGGGTSYPGDVVYWQEFGDFGRHSILEITPSGLVYSRDCTNTRTALHDPATNTVIDLGMVGNAAVSPDGTQLAGVSFDEMGEPFNKLTIVDLTSRAITDVGTQAPPDNVVWTDTNTIFYSSHTRSSEIPLPQQAADMMGNPMLPIYQSEIYFLNPSTGAQQQVLSESGFRIGRMVATGNPSTILASLVPNGDIWVAAMEQGSTGEDPIRWFLPLIYTVTGTDGGTSVSTSGDQIQIVAPHPSLNAE